MELQILTAENFDAQLAYINTKYLPVWAELLPFGIGFQGATHNRGWNKEQSAERINKLMKEITPIFQKHSPLGKKYWNTSSSYGCKHQLAEEIGANGYSTNGEFIFAMMLLDYEMKPLTKGDSATLHPNATFNCSKRNLTKIICECGLQYKRSTKTQHYKSNSHKFIMKHKEPKISIF